jgi:tRNA (guanine37-N1)-methyltransferase
MTTQKLHATFLSMVKDPLSAWLNTSIMGRAQRNEVLSTSIISILENRSHHEVDDTPYGGGAGELMRIDVIAPLINQALEQHPEVSRSQKRVILMDPAGKKFTQEHAQRLANYSELIFVCGRFEGIDARVYYYIDEALSLGDFVISCGELAALSIFDATARLVSGVLGNNKSLECESHIAGRLESSNYTRPADFEGLKVPEVLKNGNHQLISRARQEESLYKTATLRPDLIEKFPLSPHEENILRQSVPTSYPWQKNGEVYE